MTVKSHRTTYNNLQKRCSEGKGLNTSIYHTSSLASSSASARYCDMVIYLLPVDDTRLRQSPRQLHGLLQMHVVVCCAVHQVEHLVLEPLHLLTQVSLLIPLVVTGQSRHAHVPLCVC